MSKASDFKQKAKDAVEIYEMIGESGATYIFFWFSDHSITVARRKPATSNEAAAEYVFGQNAKDALDDCGMRNIDGTTYQKGSELLKRIKG